MEEKAQNRDSGSFRSLAAEAREAFLRLDSWLIWRVCLIYQIVLFGTAYLAVRMRSDYSPGVFRLILENWDSHHYLFVARNGYVTTGDDRFWIAFLPLYPLLIKALTIFGLTVYQSALIVSNALSLAGHVMFILLLKELRVPPEKIWRIALLLFCAPTAIYFAIIYTEGPYLLFLSAFFYLLLKERFVLAATVGFLAAATKVFGVYLWVAYFLFLLEDRARRLSLSNLLVSLAIPAGFGLYLWLNYALFGDPLQFLHFQHVRWYEHLANPISKIWQTFWSVASFRAPEYPTILIGEWATLLLIPICLLYLATAERRLPWSMLIWAAINWFLICSQSFWMSNLRYLALILPLYVIVEEVIGRRQELYWGIVLGFLLLSGYTFYLFSLGRWAY